MLHTGRDSETMHGARLRVGSEMLTNLLVVVVGLLVLTGELSAWALAPVVVVIAAIELRGRRRTGPTHDQRIADMAGPDPDTLPRHLR